MNPSQSLGMMYELIAESVTLSAVGVATVARVRSSTTVVVFITATAEAEALLELFSNLL